ncbi:hypothetical protein DICPUDRAFT_97855 [Dictyostelium purpureum]|uniref:Nuclear pore complex protein n=1 Tax=Dictyostelium purpureum TaxID=5786 RepID=F0ZKF5_DICPU|nr:uncharacterized protein DICPUDRAFT_97855 [Dictyostelium purpureum]EGC35584.1 hypothetical protein DICPUDRAFT_97855 [Dictyostelium purpureum]|eukprot:XP_003287887.1 hypothetical protein DICPUDRAFT_97855 [Dictyostelium purpureum]
MTENNPFKWNLNNDNNNNNNNNNNDHFSTSLNTNSLFSFNPNSNNNNKFNFNILPDEGDDDLQNMLNNNNHNNNNNIDTFGASQFGTQTLRTNFNNYELSDNQFSYNNDIQIQDIEGNQLTADYEGMQEDEIQQYNDIFNDKGRSDDFVFHNMLENEYFQPKINNPDELPIHLSNIFHKISQAKINSIENEDRNKLYYLTANKNYKDEQLNNYQMEKDTWNLISKLYDYRDILKAKEQNEKIELNNPTQSQVYQYLIKKNQNIHENSIILQWLEEMAPEIDYTTDRVFSEHTLSKLQKKGGVSMLSNDMVTELDPDASTRQNKKIDLSDETNQHKFLQSLWGCLRAGLTEKAISLCLEVEQYWRAQTFMGQIYYNGESDIGNPFFNLWKSNCFNISKNSNDSYEKAIYGLLGGNLDAVLPIQKNWYDYFWCYLRVLFDETIYRELKPYRSPLSVEEDLETSPSNNISQINTPNDILEILKNEASQIEIRNQAQNPYHIIQELVINDNYQLLFEILPSLLLKNRTPEFNRFAIFLIVFYRKRESYSIISDSEDCSENIVINEYIQYLIRSHQYDLVALYTSLLTNEDLQTKVYSKFLVNITDQAQMKQCLFLAERFGLNRQEIAETVVNNVITSGETIKPTIINSGEDYLGFGGMKSTIAQNKSIAALVSATGASSSTDILTKLPITDSIDPSTTTPDDLSKIESIKWLCFDKQLLIKALLQSNHLIREFIKLNKFSASGELLKSLPKDIILVAKQQSQLSESDTNNIIKEFRDWENYIASNTRINNWLHNYANQPKVDLSSFKLNGKESYAEKLDVERRKKEYEELYGQWNQNNITFGKEALESIKSVLNTGWLCPLENQTGEFGLDDENGQSINTLRMKCIPNLFKSLHTVLVGVGSIKKSTKICNQISNEKYKWYSVFSKKELQEILQLVRESSIKLFEVSHQI